MFRPTSNPQGSDNGNVNPSSIFDNCGDDDTSKNESSPFACLFGSSENDSAVEDLFLQLQQERLNPKKPAPASPPKPQPIEDVSPPSPTTSVKRKRNNEKQKTASLPKAWPWVPNNNNHTASTTKRNDGGGDGDVIAQALSKLSKQQREDALYDIHGVVKNRNGSGGNGQDDLESNPSQLQHLLQRMDDELSQQSASSSSSSNSTYAANGVSSSHAPTSDDSSGTCNAYNVALQMKPEYVNDTKMKLQFLRAAMYDPIEAATRMVSLLDIKLQLFGIEKLTKEHVTLDDLHDDDIATLESGFIQIVPVKDQSGRHICMITPHLLDFRGLDSVLRALFYLIMTTVEDDDIEAQKHGLVHISDFSGPNLDAAMSRLLSPVDMYRVHRLTSSLPIRIASLHVCTSHNSTFPLIINAIKNTLPATALSRIQFHFGTTIEVVDKLMGFGIPVSALPLSHNGTCAVNHHESWMQERQKADASLVQSLPVAAPIFSENQPYSSGEVVPESVIREEYIEIQPSTTLSSPSCEALARRPSICRSSSNGSMSVHECLEPTKYDVIIGRGKNIDAHPGNIQFREVLREKYMQEYEKASKFRKTELAERIIHELTESNIRFLKRDGVSHGKDSNDSIDSVPWIEVDFSTIREKIGRTFRRLRESDKNKNKGRH